MKPEELTRALHQSTQELNNELMKAEAGFQALNLGVGAEVELSDCLLGFGKDDKEWLLYARTKQPDSHKQPLTQRSRRTRVEAVYKLGHLGAALLSTSEEQLRLVREAVETARAFNADMLALLPED